jgi:hypothetical protein
LADIVNEKMICVVYKIRGDNLTQGGLKRHCTTLSSFCDTGNLELDMKELEVKVALTGGSCGRSVVCATGSLTTVALTGYGYLS